MRSNQPTDRHQRRRYRRAAMVAPALLAGTLAPLALGSGPAHAATLTASAHAAVQPNAAACDFTSGTTSSVRQSDTGSIPFGGTIFTFPAGTACHDLNLSSVSATDDFEGLLYWPSLQRWLACTEGGLSGVPVDGGPQNSANPPALCTDVKPGARMAVVAVFGARQTVTVED